MRPALSPGDGLLALRGGGPRRGQLRVFRDPTLPSRWLVKRVGGVRGTGRNATFEACSDNPRAPGVVDSRQFGWVPAAGSYRVLWTVRGAIADSLTVRYCRWYSCRLARRQEPAAF